MRNYRGQTPQGVWVYGWYFYSELLNKNYIIGESKDYGFQKMEVLPETVGQFTGLKDKNGVDIYEGDILIGVNGSVNGRGIPDKWAVKWNNAKAEFKMPLWVYDEKGEYARDDSTHWFEVRGNIHDNPLLMEVK